MKDGLKTRLIELLKEYKGNSLGHRFIEDKCRDWGYKFSNAERTLRLLRNKYFENGEINPDFLPQVKVGYYENSRIIKCYYWDETDTLKPANEKIKKWNQQFERKVDKKVAKLF